MVQYAWWIYRRRSMSNKRQMSGKRSLSRRSLTQGRFSRINIDISPELQQLLDQGLTVITTLDQLWAFFRRLRQDVFSPKQLERLGLEKRFEDWVKPSRPRKVFFWAVFDEKDDQVKNDGWGHWELYECCATRLDNGTVNFTKNQIRSFEH